jgi:uncharacterized membrane protein YkvA (DUF1232 family)
MTALTLFYCLQDPDTPKWAKATIAGALGYFILPMDLIPDFLPGAGFTDDWGALFAAIGTVAAYIKNEHRLKAASQWGRLFGQENLSAPADFLE